MMEQGWKQHNRFHPYFSDSGLNFDHFEVAAVRSFPRREDCPPDVLPQAFGRQFFLKSSRPLEPPLRPIPVEMDPDCAELVVSVSSEESVQLPLSVRSGDEKMI